MMVIEQKGTVSKTNVVVVVVVGTGQLMQMIHKPAWCRNVPVFNLQISLLLDNTIIIKKLINRMLTT